MFILPARAERAQMNSLFSNFFKKILQGFLPSRKEKETFNPVLTLPKLSNPTCAKKGDLDVLAAFSRVNEIIQLFH